MSKVVKTKNLNKSKKYVGLFIHIPFYTDDYFNNSSRLNNNMLNLYNNYIKALLLELQSYKKKLSNHIISSIFIGGGAEGFCESEFKNEVKFEGEAVKDKNEFKLTNKSVNKLNKNKKFLFLNNSLNLHQINNENKTYNNAIKQVLSLIKQLFKLQKDLEVTIETNAAFVHPKTAKTWQLCGVNRVSLVFFNTPKKLQKAICKSSEIVNNSNQLYMLNKNYNQKVFEKAVGVLKQNGVNNINADLVLGYPHQKASDNKKIVKSVVKQNITHVSLYDFVLEDYEDIMFLASNKKINLLPDTKAISLFNKSEKCLQKNGFNRYEISHFSKPSFESKHALSLWSMQEFVGFGEGAYSFFNNSRYNNFSSVNNYIKSINEKHTAVEHLSQLNSTELFEDTVMLALQTVKGLDLNKILKQYNTDLLKEKQHKINEFIKLGYVELSNNYLSLTKAGFAVYNKIVLELVY